MHNVPVMISTVTQAHAVSEGVGGGGGAGELDMQMYFMHAV